MDDARLNKYTLDYLFQEINNMDAAAKFAEVMSKWISLSGEGLVGGFFGVLRSLANVLEPLANLLSFVK
ncbi:hypothetical protein P4N68_03365 [Corynebacterium felinum]|uniref:Uncharacterized protein n=1 Tax=Corynebacterium felinum TaxID=131318 RepID=A0ABU2B5H9_9CORY|nr:hypothetical protein [Corynebacterium felinum]MDF5820122.1 hypothetical protein [Corynebacterium felinum]MDR7353872.1 hypothetical protein [Corynebacterium felinum]WJY96046.1 hypothetical protein CFELI_12325 [Corynebacterium felinum]